MKHQTQWVIKANGQQERFKHGKLFRSLLNSGLKRSIAISVANQVKKQLQRKPIVSSFEIFDLIQRILKADHRPTANRYNLKRALFELGPTGFPFEALIRRLFHKLNYDEVSGGEILQGKCVSHEVDLIASNSNNIEWGECKFHQLQGTVCDLKTILYVYARYLDLFENSKDSRQKSMWLITNTRFSQEAKQFAECRGIQLLGWDYPEKRGLQTLLPKNDIIPITTIASLSNKQKDSLIQEGVITTADFLLLPPHATFEGLSKHAIERVKREILDSFSY